MRSGAVPKTTKRCGTIRRPHLNLQQALALAEFEPGMYEVVETFAPVLLG
jgi:hypothetical protein